jgi:hypothetical protein
MNEATTTLTRAEAEVLVFLLDRVVAHGVHPRHNFHEVLFVQADDPSPRQVLPETWRPFMDRALLEGMIEVSGVPPFARSAQCQFRVLRVPREELFVRVPMPVLHPLVVARVEKLVGLNAGCDGPDYPG